MSLSIADVGAEAFPLASRLINQRYWPAQPAHDGISFDAATGLVTLKAPGGAPSVVPFATAFPFTRSTTGTYLDKGGLLLTAGVNVPRTEYGADGELWGFLSENGATNLAIQSEDWTTSHVGAGILSVTANAIASPTGAVNADKLIEDTGAAQHRIRDTTETTIVSGSTYAHSCFFKAGERTKCSLRMTESTFAASCEAHFDLVTGAVSAVSNVGTASGARGYMIRYPNGWWRCVLVGALNGGFVLARFIQEVNDSSGNYTYTGDGVSGLFVFGEQIELGLFATSYIPTTTIAVTRGNDFPNRTLGSEFVAGANTIVVKGRASQGQQPTLQPAWILTAGADSLFMGRAPNSDIARMNAFTASVAQGPADGGNFTNGAYFASAAAWLTTNDMAHSLNGGAAAPDTVASLLTPTALALATNGSDGFQGHIRSFDLYNFRAPNAQLPVMSAL